MYSRRPSGRLDLGAVPAALAVASRVPAARSRADARRTIEVEPFRENVSEASALWNSGRRHQPVWVTIGLAEKDSCAAPGPWRASASRPPAGLGLARATRAGSDRVVCRAPVVPARHWFADHIQEVVGAHLTEELEALDEICRQSIVVRK